MRPAASDQLSSPSKTVKLGVKGKKNNLCRDTLIANINLAGSYALIMDSM